MGALVKQYGGLKSLMNHESAYVCYKNRVDKLSNEIDKLDDLIQEEESIEEVLEEARHTLTWINGLWATDVPELIEDGGYEDINDLLFYKY